MSNFNLNVYTPAGILEKNFECDSLVIPTVRGEINVLKGHTHIISELANGVLKAKSKDGDKLYNVTNGLVKVLGADITILAKDASAK